MTASYPAAGGGIHSRRDSLFVACCVSLIVTAMSFAIRGDIMGALGSQFHLDKGQVGAISGTAFWGFTLAMVFGGPLCDVVGMKRLLILAFVGHLAGIFITIFAGGYWTLYVGTLSIGLANGFVEGACNPLIATLYPDQKIKRLGLFHCWFPGGIVIGGLIAFAITKFGLPAGLSWQVKMATMLIPLAIYGFLFAKEQLPVTERVAAGVSTGEMFSACLHPFFLLFVGCMLLTAATELGPGQWIPNILTVTTGATGILFLVWQNGLMAVGRTFAGQLVHRIPPNIVLIGSAFFSSVGLYLLGNAHNAMQGIVAETIFAVGVCFFWPTMLGTVSERFPKTGSLGLAIMGGAGMLASAYAQPLIGHKYDEVAAQTAHLTMAQYIAAGDNIPAAALAAGGAAGLLQLVKLPVILIGVFALIYLYDRSRGGYKKETLSETALENAEMTPANQA